MFNGSRLKELRKRKGITQQELGRIVNVTKNSISSYENGSRVPNLETLIALVNYFDTTPNYLLGYDSIREDYDLDNNYVISCTYDDYEILKEIKKNKKFYDLCKRNTKDIIKYVEDNYSDY